jgi:serine/threonine-protein kinase
LKQERAPETIGRYRIQGELGRGMMGVVYEAHDPSLNRRVALKVVRLLFAITDAEKDSFERRFLSEARIAARLSHPGIVVVHDIGRDPETGILYIALERLRGRTLSEMTAQGPLPWRQALEITVQVARALAYAHAQGVVHRDIKPANVMVLATGEPKIMDFGLAKHEAGHEHTAAGQFMGTPLFMAPEQVLGQNVDGRTDLFSLGAVLYTLLTGTRAFAADGVPQIMSRVAHQEPRPAAELVKDLPHVLDDVLARAMAKDPDERYPTGEELATDLEDVLAGRPPRHLAGWTRPRPAEGTMISTLEPPAPPPPPAPKRQRHLLRTFVLALLLAGSALYYFRSPWPDRLVGALTAMLFPVAPPSLAPPVTLAPATAPPPPAPADEPIASPAATPTPDASPTPGPAPTRSPATRPAPTPKPPAKPSPSPRPASLAVHMEHHLKSGTVRVWLDDRLVVEERLDARVTGKILFFPVRKGLVEERLKVTPGRHELRVQVKWDDNTEVKRIAGTFRAGATKQLEIGISRLGGDLSVDWK